MVGEMSVRRNVLVGNVQSGKCPSGKYPVGELSVQGNVRRGSVRQGSVSRGFVLGKCQSGKCTVGKLSYNHFTQVNGSRAMTTLRLPLRVHFPTLHPLLTLLTYIELAHEIL